PRIAANTGKSGIFRDHVEMARTASSAVCVWLADGTEGERHRAVHDALTVNRGDTTQHADATPQPVYTRFDHDDIARMHGPTIPHALDAGEERQPLPVLRFREHENRADLRDRFRENRRRQHGTLSRLMFEVALVHRHVLDADDALVE